MGMLHMVATLLLEFWSEDGMDQRPLPTTRTWSVNKIWRNWSTENSVSSLDHTENDWAIYPAQGLTEEHTNYISTSTARVNHQMFSRCHSTYFTLSSSHFYTLLMMFRQQPRAEFYRGKTETSLSQWYQNLSHRYWKAPGDVVHSSYEVCC